MLRSLRQTVLILGQEIADGFRSRRAAVVFLLYVSVCALMMYALVGLLQKIETQLATALDLKTASRPGAVVDSLWKSQRFQEMVEHATGNRDATVELTAIPPVALVFGFPAFFFLPLLILIVSAPRVAEEVGSGSARYALLRATRGEWIAGKFLAQTVLLATAILLGAAGAWMVARFRGAAPDGLRVGLWMLWLAGRVWLYGLPFLGLAFAASMSTRSAAKATGLGLIIFIVMGLLAVMAEHYHRAGAAVIRDLGELLSPNTHRSDLWRTNPAYWGTAAVHMVILTWAYLGLAFAFFRRRDL